MKNIRPFQSNQGHSIPRRFARATHLAIIATLLLFVACEPPAEEEEAGRERLPEGTTMKIIVVDDSAMAEQIRLQSGTWETTTGASLEVIEWTVQEYGDTASLEADVLITSPYEMGNLIERDWIQSPALLNEKGPSMFGEGAGEEDAVSQELLDSWRGHFSLLREREAKWGKEVYGVPLGSPVFVLYYRRDLLEKIERDPPADWAEYVEVVELLSAQNETEFAAVEPVGPGWGGLSLLARAAPYSLSPDDYSFPFDINTMDSLVATSAFVRALEEMQASLECGGGAVLDFDALACADPDAVRRLFWAERTALAVTWPTASMDEIETLLEDDQVGVAILPGVMNTAPGSGVEIRNVPLVSMSGRMGFVTKETEQPDYALELLLWLSSEELGANTAIQSEVTMPFRDDQIRGILNWIEPVMGARGAIEYADAVMASYGGRQCALAPRIAGRERYLAALDQAVQAVLSGELTPQEALNTAALEWDAVTQELGVDAQRDAYRKSLGMR